jgi:hypothetical protein
MIRRYLIQGGFMSIEVAGKVRQRAMAAVQDQQVRDLADAQERALVLQQLKDVLDEQDEQGDISWQGYELALKAGSSLHEVYMPGRVMWNRMLRHTLLIETIRDHKPQSLDYVRVTGTGEIAVLERSTLDWKVIAGPNTFHRITGFPEQLSRLADIAQQCGGYIQYEDFVGIDQWLRFHDLDVPKNLAQVKNLIGLFDFEIPAVEPLTAYWAQLVAEQPSQVVLTAAQQQSVRQVTAQLVPAKKRLLDVLYEQSKLPAATHDNASQLIGQLIRQPVAQGYARKYIELLNWYGAEPGQTLSEEDLGQVLLTAILLDLNPFIGKANGRKSVGSFQLYEPAFVERPAFIALEALHGHLLSNQWVSAAAAPLAAHLLLAEIAPEFVVRQVPNTALLGSPGWVAFSRGVALVEAVSKGAACVMTHAQVMAYAALEPVSPAQEQLQALALIEPLVDWAILNAVITPQALQQDKKAATERAVAAYQGYAEDFARITHAFAAPLPDRQAIARQALQQAAPDCDFLEAPLLFQRPGLYASPTAMSILDLHMSGDLTGGAWDLRGVHPTQPATDLLGAVSGRPKPAQAPVTSLFSRFPQLTELPANNIEFQRQLRAHLQTLDQAMLIQLQLALAQLPISDLEALLQSEISLFSVRDSAAFTRITPIGGPLVREEQVESQQGRDAATGRYGLILCFTARERVTCYELFRLRGEIRPNPALGKFLVDSGKLRGASRAEFKGDLKAHLTPATKERVPLDLRCYTEGVGDTQSSASSLAIIDKLAVLAAPQAFTRLAQSVYRNFSDPQLLRLAEFIVKTHPLISLDELQAIASKPTALELEREQGERTATYLLDLAVPFKKCVEDLASGEHNRIVDGVYGCAMDSIALVGAFAGAATKAASISAKAVSLGSKSARLAKLMVGTSIALFNPLDDVPAVLSGLGKLLHKGGLRLSKETQQLLALAKIQLGKTRAGQATQNVISASATATIGQGHWRPTGATGEARSVLAAREEFRWYALDRRGKPWGQPLGDFSYQAPGRFVRPFKTLPASYTRHFIEQSLPLARQKIDNAIQALTQHDFARERAVILRALMGSDPVDALDRMLKYLKTVRTDFAGASISNFLLDPFKDTDHLAAFNKAAYTLWKGARGEPDTPFIEVYSRNFNRHFIHSGFNQHVVADDLIHEMFHGAADTADVSHAQETRSETTHGQVLNVTPLLNLARGYLPLLAADGAAGYHASSRTFANADSLALTTALLSQLLSDKPTCLQNLALLSAAVETDRNASLTQPVLLTLNQA